MVIADIRATGTYEDTLRTLGASDIERRRLGWRFWWGNPIARTTLATSRVASPRMTLTKLEVPIISKSAQE